MTILNRSEVDKNLTWDTSAIFKSKEEARKEANDLLEASLKLKENYEGKLNDFDTIVKAFKEYEEIIKRFSLVIDYAYLNKDVDMTNSAELAFFNELLNMYNKLDENTLFVELEIAKLDIPMLEKLEKVDGLKVYFHNVILKKKTYLSDAEEKVIQAFTPLRMAPEQLYNTIKLQDLTFEPFEVNGKKYNNSYALFEEKYEYDEDKDLRRESFNHFYKDLSKTVNSTTMAFNLNMQKDKIMSKLRGYDSVTDYLLAEQEVPREIYENHLDTIMKELSPVMRKFARVLKDGLGLEKINYYDLKANIDPEFDPEITLDGAKDYILRQLASHHIYLWYGLARWTAYLPWYTNLVMQVTLCYRKSINHSLIVSHLCSIQNHHRQWMRWCLLITWWRRPKILECLDGFTSQSLPRLITIISLRIS